jgi:hypothetical protein
MPPRVDAAPPRPAQLSRTSHPTPWARPAARQLDRPRAGRRARPAPPPVFVDDSGRRRRAGRLLGACLAALVLSYVGVVGLTFSGAPLIGRLAPPGVDQLARPAGDAGLGVGPGAQESPLPAAAAPDETAERRETVPVDGALQPAGTSAAPATTVPAAVTTTTTLAPGQSTSSTVPTPSSTVPERTHSTGGPPTEPPGKP